MRHQRQHRTATAIQSLTVASLVLLAACASDLVAPGDEGLTIRPNPAIGVEQSTFSGAGVVKARKPVATGSAALTIHEFTMIEIGGLGSGYYAPQVRLSAPPGRSITVLVVSFSIPGIGAIPPWSCDGVITGSTVQSLNGEVYGSWTLEIGGSGVATGDPSVVVTFVDDNRNFGAVTVKGRIVQGSFPQTYTGGENGGPCFHGYRPPG